MTTIQEQYAELLKQGQDEALSALKAWNRTVRRAFGQLPTTGLTSAGQMIDEFYDFRAHVLDAQREFAKQFIATSTTAAEKVRDSITPTAVAAADEAPTARVATAKFATAKTAHQA
ncbi:MAG: hypothetical protein ABSA02_00470 [Trebonia sp.]